LKKSEDLDLFNDKQSKQLKEFQLAQEERKAHFDNMAGNI
jgi:hypothetical protein